MALLPLAGNEDVDDAVRQAQSEARGRPREAAPWIRLGQAFVRKARVSADSRWYARADDAARRALDLDSGSPDALVLQGHVLQQDHRFFEVRSIARRVLASQPENVLALGLLGDALLELGDYEGATDAYQQMVDLRPESRSYGRAAWMRWLLGDPDGAVEAYRLAIDAVNPRDTEAKAWLVVQLGIAQFSTGDLASASETFDAALSIFPGYAPALFARGRMFLAEGKVERALPDLRAAVEKSPLIEHRWALHDALDASGDVAGARAQAAEIERLGPAEDPRTTAHFLAAKDRDHDRAVELARAELARRDDVASADVLSWALVRAGRLDEARRQSDRALRLETRDARMLFHAGMIAVARGENERAKDLLRRCLDANPVFDRLEAPAARAALARLSGQDQS